MKEQHIFKCVTPVPEQGTAPGSPLIILANFKVSIKIECFYEGAR